MKTRNTKTVVPVIHVGETLRLKQSLHLLLIGEPANRLDEVVIRIGMTCDHRAETRNYMAIVSLVKRPQRRRRRRKLETKQTAARFQHTPDFSQCGIDVGNIANPLLKKKLSYYLS